MKEPRSKIPMAMTMAESTQEPKVEGRVAGVCARIPKPLHTLQPLDAVHKSVLPL